jgi:hypothetical protein
MLLSLPAVKGLDLKIESERQALDLARDPHAPIKFGVKTGVALSFRGYFRGYFRNCAFHHTDLIRFIY